MFYEQYTPGSFVEQHVVGSPQTMEADRFFARQFGDHVVRQFFYPDGTRKDYPSCTPEHAEFYARLAASYAARVIVHEANVRVGWKVLRGLLGRSR
jgi:hypothetical protein